MHGLAAGRLWISAYRWRYGVDIELKAAKPDMDSIGCINIVDEQNPAPPKKH